MRAPDDHRPRGRSIATVRDMLALRDGEPDDEGTYHVRCIICRGFIDMTTDARTPNGPTIEHLIPISHGGTSDLTNLRLAHRVCNLGRGNRPIITVGPQSRAWL